MNKTNYRNLLIIFILLALLPLVLVELLDMPFIYRMIALGLIWALFAIGYDICFGYTGMVSFGHAAFFGIGGYGAIMSIKYNYIGISSIWIALLFAIILSVIFSIIIGYFSVKVGGIYHALITFAFANVLYLLVLADPCSDIISIKACSTNSMSGLSSTPPAINLGFTEISLFSGTNFYYYTLILFILTYIAVKYILDTPLGDAYKGIRENDERMEAIGYDVEKLKLSSFVLSGAVSGLAGGLLAFFNLGVDPSQLHWTVSGTILFMDILGGPGTLIGPAIGGTVITLLELIISDVFAPEIWNIIFGLSFVLLILFLPNGMYKPIEKTYNYILNKLLED